ncbi:MAG: cupin domain-containing protein [Chitinophagaceae bacterium]|nr:cupin domain-containing protein [Chitinophagaceae bacterium]
MENKDIFYDFSHSTPHEIFPGFIARFRHTEFCTIAYVEIKKNAKLPEHKHPEQQISKVLKGEFLIGIKDADKNDVTIDMKTNESTIAIIPSNVVHYGIALTDCVVMDIFFPRREDFIQKYT